MALGVVTLVVPLRALLLCAVLLAYVVIALLLHICARICRGGTHVDHHRTLYAQAELMITRTTARLLLFCLGFYYISTRGRLPEVAKLPRIVVCNHVSIIEILHLLSSPLSPSFLAKESILGIPIIGIVARDILQCIGVSQISRASVPKRLSAAQGIGAATRNASVELKRWLSRWPRRSIAIFPEGTTSNGKCLLRFRSGAFFPGETVLPVVYQLDSSAQTTFVPSFESIFFPAFIWRLLAQPWNNLSVEYLHPHKPHASERKNPQKFASNVRKKMARCLGVPLVDAGYRDKLEYHGNLRRHFKKHPRGPLFSMIFFPDPEQT